MNENSHTIILFDEDTLGRKFLTKLLMKEGFSVIPVADAYEGFKLAHKNQLDLILIDITSAKTKGLDICKALKKDPSLKDIPVIFLTSQEDRRDIVKGFEVGAVDLVCKPVFMPELLARLRTHISIKKYADELKQKNEQLEELNTLLKHVSRKDALTDIWNRGAFDIQLKRVHYDAHRENRIYSLLLADIDFFKAYNDHYGHQAGDRVLQETGKIFKNMCQRADFIARYGGEEIVVILPEKTLDEAKQQAQRIVNTLWQRNLVHENSPIADRITVTMGIAQFSPGVANQEYEEIIKRADMALYWGKNNGRNRIELFIG